MHRLTAAFLTGLTLLGSAAAIEAASLTRTSAFEYDATSGLLTKEIIEPDSPNLCLVTTYTYDPYGNQTASTTRNCNGSSSEAAAPTGDAVFTSRTSSTGFDTQGRFPTSSSNALGHSETRVYDARFGKPTQLTGPNGLTTTWAYDGFGRKTLETRADASTTAWSYLECDSSCPSYAKYYVQTLSTGAPESRTYYDAYNREVRSASVGFDGRWVYKDTEYNAQGQVYRVSRPYYSGDAVYWTSSAYDEIGRPFQIEDADGTLTQISYSGLTTLTTNPKGQTKTEIKNSQGQLISVADADDYTTTFTYDAFGNLTQTPDPNGNQIVNTYDLRGRKTAMNDPDMGNWTYAYNALGQLIRQTDAKNQIVSNTYDKLGRLTQRAEPDLISTWYYDQYKDGSACAVGIGKLCEIASDNAMAQKIYYEGQAGRISVVTHTIDTTYTAYRSYDSQGRANTQSVNAVFATRNVYNAYGYLNEVRRDSDNSLLWRADSMDAEGRITKATLGNGVTADHVFNAQNGRLTSIQANGPNGSVQNQTYVYDSIGNLSSRSDGILASSESYTYDDLNRLTAATKNGISVTVQYDALGNITHKSDVGAYTYGRPHGVTKAGSNSYTYDANGNQLSGAGRTNTWTSYNLPSQIVESTGTTTFLYDYNHVRAKQTSPGKTVIYLNPRIDLGGHYNKETAGSIVTESYYFYAGGQVVGAYITKTNASPQTNYFHADHLGSISVVTNATGQVIARYAYDAWGKRTLASGSSATIHGFTGHEHLDDGLIHMNGRVYDPVLGRFLSADPYIQDPGNLQSYNRYSYVLNNPLFYTDPSGYFSLSKFFKKVLKPLVSIAAAWYLGPVAFNTGFWGVGTALGGGAAGVIGGTIAGGALAGATTQLLSTGSVNGWQQAGLTSMLFFGAGEVGDSFERYSTAHFAAHAGAGCISAEAGGGSCGRGAMSAVAGLEGTKYGPVGAIVAGGTVSAIGGGKFANGATTAAFGYLFNYCMHGGQCTSKFEQFMYDWWPGYKFGTGIYNSLNGGGFEFTEGVDGIFAIGGIAGKGAGLVGQAFGKLGTVVEGSGLAISGFTRHGIDQAISRGVGPAAMIDAVRNPLAVLQQGSGNYLHIGEQAAVVLNSAGRVVTTYPARMYDSAVQAIANAARGGL
jgi:RHS repeat-associated protein